MQIMKQALLVAFKHSSYNLSAFINIFTDCDKDTSVCFYK